MFTNLDIDAFVVIERGNGCTLQNGRGYILGKEQSLEIANGLINFFKDFTEDDIEQYNIEREQELNQEWEQYFAQCKAESKQKKAVKPAYVYLLECGGRYKIGFSDDVKRRVKELDRRPFPIKIIVKSRLIDFAYDKEQAMHSKYKDYRVYGEWYAFDGETLSKVILDIITL